MQKNGFSVENPFFRFVFRIISISLHYMRPDLSGRKTLTEQSMNYSKLLAAAMLLFTACGSDDGPGKDAGRPNFNEGFKYLKSLNVSDARMIYRRESASRSADGAGYWKIDFSGNETKLVITDSLGQNHDIYINKVVKLSDRLLLIDPDVIQILDLLSPIGPDEMVSVPLFGYLSIVDVKTEKLYRWPQELKRLLGTNYDWKFTTATDSRENLYFTLNQQWDRGQIYKLDVGDFTIRPLLPDGVPFTDFTVTDDGFLFFWHRNTGDYRVKCPGGNIVPLTGQGFCCEDKLYAVEDGKIYLWETSGDNALNKREVCDASALGNGACLLTNNVRQTAIFETRHSETPRPECIWAVEFDGTGFSAPFQLPQLFRDIALAGSPEFLTTSQAWYIYRDKQLYKLSMQDYFHLLIEFSDYEIQHITATPAQPDLHFRGFRYSDGKNVVGTITGSNDEIVIDAVADSGRIIDLIPID